jgi:hypothetical protein
MMHLHTITVITSCDVSNYFVMINLNSSVLILLHLLNANLKSSSVFGINKCCVSGASECNTEEPHS